ncbi:hypothetical protein CH313_19090 [Streptomyces sp. TSRI0384-2]|nr:hypothetical protein CH313_19090 [Streptomyces sp. TSRI0384-2]
MARRATGPRGVPERRGLDGVPVRLDVLAVSRNRRLCARHGRTRESEDALDGCPVPEPGRCSRAGAGTGAAG